MDHPPHILLLVDLIARFGLSSTQVTGGHFISITFQKSPHTRLCYNSTGCFQANCLEYVAIAGRTGAVKSSLVSGLFRQTELSRGSVSIDGGNVSDVSLQALRSGTLSINP